MQALESCSRAYTAHPCSHANTTKSAGLCYRSCCFHVYDWLILLFTYGCNNNSGVQTPSLTGNLRMNRVSWVPEICARRWHTLPVFDFDCVCVQYC